MLSRSLLLVFLATSCHSQYQVENDMRADITFNVDNDRFDVGNIIEEQKRAYNDQPTLMEEDWRRNFQPLAEVLKQHRRQHRQPQPPRRMNNDFAYHDQMFENDEINDQYDKNLRSWLTENQRTQRKSGTNFLFKKLSLRSSGNIEDSVTNVEDPVANIEDPVTNVKDQVTNVKDRIPKFVDLVDNVEDLVENIGNPINNDKIQVNNIEDTVNNFEDMIKNETKEPVKKNKTMKGLQEVVLNYLHGGEEVRQGRRKSEANPEDEILLHYAVPISMKIKGFLELPDPQAL